MADPPDIDYAALFAVTPSPCLILTADLVITDVNRAYLRVTGRERAELIGRPLIEAFPANPADPAADGMRNLRASVARALATGEQDVMAPQKYDIPVPDRPGVFEERYWSPINTPIPGTDERPALVIHRVEDVTGFIRGERRHRPGGDHPYERRQEMEAELYARAKELQVLNERLRLAHAREREVALTLQRTMLQPDSATPYADVAVRYLPAGSLNICGDWFELVDLGGDRLAAAVGDVVGHGLRAAGVMGQLRSALSAAIRAADGPAGALEVLGRYACSVEGALATTVVQTVIDRPGRTILYSCAGHPPPVLVHPGGRCVLLDGATDPPLGVRSCPDGHPQARVEYEPGATLALYTDGLVERRGEDIDEGLNRLTGALSGHGTLPPEALADVVLAELGVSGGGEDDIALVVLRL
ncbi:SpoIIE family protein phosphatase [Actinomadura sp. DC4]|uniref:PP2C family protein-serine/threonine phosphatase n=1 Tax=Actinomadura sp. DC4 TaxID=3055069 RepID=UPI0025AF5E03|nr:SpoIIE family protein phosphatase [Actinomadura sp. DC4]MDN3359837.1 SpoIIE family protein phosphatase [Actinomadura sp. DC4]